MCGTIQKREHEPEQVKSEPHEDGNSVPEEETSEPEMKKSGAEQEKIEPEQQRCVLYLCRSIFFCNVVKKSKYTVLFYSIKFQNGTHLYKLMHMNYVTQSINTDGIIGKK